MTENSSGTTAIEGNGEADSVSSACDLTGNEDKCATGTTATLVKRSTVPHNFHNSWLEKWPWLQLRNKLMYCKTCEKHKKMNALTTGCSNFRTSTLERHTVSSDHQISLKNDGLSKDFKIVSIANVFL